MPLSLRTGLVRYCRLDQHGIHSLMVSFATNAGATNAGKDGVVVSESLASRACVPAALVVISGIAARRAVARELGSPYLAGGYIADLLRQRNTIRLAARLPTQPDAVALNPEAAPERATSTRTPRTPRAAQFLAPIGCRSSTAPPVCYRWIDGRVPVLKGRKLLISPVTWLGRPAITPLALGRNLVSISRIGGAAGCSLIPHHQTAPRLLVTGHQIMPQPIASARPRAVLHDPDTVGRKTA